jgi:hypothetical protein
MQDSPNKGGGEHLTTIEELQDIRELIQLYIEGSDGDATMLQRVFHPDARMVGCIGGEDGNSPIGEFIAWVAENPGLAGPDYQALIRSIDLTGDAGVVVLVEKNYFGCDFVDYFSVARTKGVWQIISKTYQVTGGAPPSH